VVVDGCYTRINNHKTTFQIGSLFGITRTRIKDGSTKLDAIWAGITRPNTLFSSRNFTIPSPKMIRHPEPIGDCFGDW
jgi:hypothetical protein